MEIVILKCSRCKAKVRRSHGRINEAKKFGWKTYCSLGCQTSARNIKQEFQCSRPSCGKTFARAPHKILSTAFYCSQACAAIINNSKYPKRKAAIKKCLYCKKNFKSNDAYCSRDCKNQSQVMKTEEVSKRIKEFYFLPDGLN